MAEIDYDYDPQIGDEVEMNNGEEIEKGIVVAPEDMEQFKSEWDEIPPFLIKWNNDGTIEDWTGITGSFYDMGGVVTKKAHNNK